MGLTRLPPLSFAQTVAAVGGQTKSRLPFHCGSDSSCTSSDGETRMPSRRGSTCRKETKLKRKSLSLRNHSVIFPVDEESVYQRPAEESFFPPPFTNTIPSTIYPPAKVKQHLYLLICASILLPPNLIKNSILTFLGKYFRITIRIRIPVLISRGNCFLLRQQPLSKCKKKEKKRKIKRGKKSQNKI